MSFQTIYFLFASPNLPLWFHLLFSVYLQHRKSSCIVCLRPYQMTLAQQKNKYQVKTLVSDFTIEFAYNLWCFSSVSHLPTHLFLLRPLLFGRPLSHYVSVLYDGALCFISLCPIRVYRVCFISSSSIGSNIIMSTDDPAHSLEM